MAENVAPYCERIPTGVPSFGLIDITCATDKAQAHDGLRSVVGLSFNLALHVL